MRHNLLDGCPIADLLNGDGRFLVAMNMAISILADRAKQPELTQALLDELNRWALDKGYIEP